jgi:hypothetical protein
MSGEAVRHSSLDALRLANVSERSERVNGHDGVRERVLRAGDKEAV